MRRPDSRNDDERLYELETLEPRIMLSTEGADALAAGMGNLAHAMVDVAESDASLNEDLPSTQVSIADAYDPAEVIEDPFAFDGLDEGAETPDAVGSSSEAQDGDVQPDAPAGLSEGPSAATDIEAHGMRDPDTESGLPDGARDDAENADVQTRRLTTSLCCANAPPENAVESGLPTASDASIQQDHQGDPVIHPMGGGAVPERPVLLLHGVAASFPTEDFVGEWLVTRGIEPERPVDGSPGEYVTVIEIDPIGGFYNDIIQTLTNSGYVDGQSLFIATYDWRLPVGPDDGNFDGHLDGLSGPSITDGNYAYGVDYLGYWLAKASEAWHAEHGEYPVSVDLITHSTGGLVARAYIQSDAYGDVYDTDTGKSLPEVHHFVMVGVPNRGASKAWNALHNNFVIEPAYRAVMSKILYQSYLRLEAGQTISGPDGEITLDGITDPLTGEVDFELFILRYVPTLRGLLATYPFLIDGPDGEPRHINADTEAAGIARYRNNVILDLNAGLDVNWFFDEQGVLDDQGSLDTDLYDPLPFLDKLSGDVVVIYSEDVKTVTQAQALSGPEDHDSFLPAIVGLDAFVGRSPEAGEVWYRDLTAPDAPAGGGDGTVPVESARDLFFHHPTFRNDASGHRLYRVSIPEDVEDKHFFGLLEDPAYALGHSALMGNLLAQREMLRTLGVTFEDEDISTGLTHNPMTMLDVAFQRGILDFDWMENEISPAQTALLLGMFDSLDDYAARVDQSETMSTELPVIGIAPADLIGFEALLKDELTDPLRDYLETAATATWFGLAAALWDRAMLLDDLALPEWQDGIFRMHIPLRAVTDWSHSVDYAVDADGVSLDTHIALSGSASGALNLVLRVDTRDGIPDDLRVTMLPGDMDLEVVAAADGVDATARIGLFEAAVSGGTGALECGFSVGWAPGNDAGWTADALDGSDGDDVLRNAAWRGAFNLSAPFGLDFLGQDAQGWVAIEWTDLSRPDTFDFSFQWPEEIPDVRTITAENIVDAIVAFIDSAYTQLYDGNHAWLHRPLPVVGRSPGELIRDARSELESIRATIADWNRTVDDLLREIEEHLELAADTLEAWLETFERLDDTTGVRLHVSGAMALLDVDRIVTPDIATLAAIFGAHWPSVLDALWAGGAFEGEISVETGLVVTLAAGLDLYFTDGAEKPTTIAPFIGNASGLTLEAWVHAQNIAHDQTVVDGKTLWVRDGHIRLGDNPFDQDPLRPATLTVSLDAMPERIYLGGSDALDLRAELTGGFDARLPVYYGDTNAGYQAAGFLDSNNPALFFSIADFNEPTAIAWGVPGIGPILNDLNELTRDQMLDLLVRVADWLTEMGKQTILSQPVPFTDRTLGELLDLGEAWRQRVLILAEEAFETAEELADRIEELFDWKPERQGDMLTIPVRFNPSWDKAVGFYQDFPGVAVNGVIEGQLRAKVDLDIAFELALVLAPVAQSQPVWQEAVLDRVFLRNLDIQADINLIAEDLQVSALWGMLGLVVGAEGRLDDGTMVSASVGIEALPSPADNGQEWPGWVDLRELNAKLPTLHQFIEAPQFAFDAHFDLPIDVTLTARDPITEAVDESLAALFAASEGLEPKIEIQWHYSSESETIPQPHRAIVTLHGLDDLPSLGSLNFHDFLQMLRALGRSLERMAGEAAMNREIPLTGGRTLGEMVDLAGVYADRILTVIEAIEDAEDSAQGNYQQVRRELIRALDLAEDAIVFEDSAILFNLILSPETVCLNGENFSARTGLGPFELSLSGTMQGEASAGFEMTVGIDLDWAPLVLSAGRAWVAERLPEDVSFLVSGIDGGLQPVSITVPAGEYSSADDVAAVINEALEAAGIGHLVEAATTIAGFIELRAVAGQRHLGLLATDNPAGLDLLGFNAGIQVHRPLDELMFLQDLTIDAELEFAVSDIEGLAIFADLLEVGVVDGHLRLTGSGGNVPAGIRVGFPENAGRVYLKNLRDLQTEIAYTASAQLSFSLSADGLMTLNPDTNSVTLTVNDLSELGEDGIVVESQGLDNLFDFEQITLDEILDIVWQLLERLDLPDVMDVKIPVLNRSVNEMFDWADGVIERVSNAIERALDAVDRAFDAVDRALDWPGNKLAQIEQAINEVLPDGMIFRFEFQTADQDRNLSPALLAVLDMGYQFEKNLPFSLDLLDLLGADNVGNLAQLVNISSAGHLKIEGAVRAGLGAGLEWNVDASAFAPFLAGDSFFKFDLRIADAEGIKFNAALGPFGIFVKDGVVRLSEKAEEGNAAWIRFGFVDSQGAQAPRLYFGDNAEWTLDIKMDGEIEVDLPIYFPTHNDRLTFEGNDQSLSLTVPCLETLLVDGETGGVSFGLPVFDDAFDDFEIDLSMILQGVEMLLIQLADALDAGVFGQTLPVIGRLDNAAGFLRDMADNVGTIRETLPNDLDGMIDQVLEQLVVVLEGMVPDVAVLDDALADHEDFVDRLETLAEDLAIMMQRIEEIDEADVYTFMLGIGGAYSLDTGDVNFDIGLPGLGLSVEDAGVAVKISFAATLTFGYCKQAGFFVGSTDLDIELDAGLSLGSLDAGGGATGRLGFLEILVGGEAKLAAGTRLSLDTGEAGRIPLHSLAQEPFLDRFEFALGAAADVGLDFKLQFGGTASSFPSIRGDLIVAWGWGDRINENPDGENGYYPESPHVALQNIRLDLGGFLDNTLGPILRWIDDVLEPIRPLIDFLTQPVPGVSDLAGYDISLLDMATEVGAYFDIDLIEAVIAIMDIVNKFPSYDDSGHLVLVKEYVLDDDSREPLDLNLDTVRGALIKPDEDAHETGEDTEKTLRFLDSLRNIGIEFPLLDNPSLVIGLLFGRDVPLIVYDMPALELDFDFRLNFPFWTPPTIAVSVGAGVGVKIDPVFGYDTRGARAFMEARTAFRAGELSDPPSVSLLLHGFYALADRDRPPLTLGAEVFAGLMVNAGIKAGIDGVIALDVHLHFKDVQGVGKLYVDDLLRFQQTTLGLFCAFEASGEISAALRFWLSFLGRSREWDIVSVTLFDFNITPKCEPLEDTETVSDLIRQMHIFDENAPYAARHAGVVPGVNRGETAFATQGSKRTIMYPDPDPDPDAPDTWIAEEVETHGVNWYRVELLSPDDLRIRMRPMRWPLLEGTMLPSPSYLGLFSEAGDLLARSEVWQMDVKNLEAGVYYVGVSLNASGVFGAPDSYLLTVEPAPTSNTTVWYLNDDVYEHDSGAPSHYYTLAPGGVDNHGHHPESPLAGLDQLPDDLDPSRRHLVVFDTGFYSAQTLTQSGLTLAGAPVTNVVVAPGGETLGLSGFPNMEGVDMGIGQSVFLHGNGIVGLHLSDVHSTTVHGFTFANMNFEHASSRQGPGLLTTGSGADGPGVNTVRHSLFLAPGDAGIWAASAQPLRVEHNRFIGLSGTTPDGVNVGGLGVLVTGQNRAWISDNIFRMERGIEIETPFLNIIQDNDFFSYLGGVRVSENGSARIGQNRFAGGEWGVSIHTEREMVVEKNVFEAIGGFAITVDQSSRIREEIARSTQSAADATETRSPLMTYKPLPTGERLPLLSLDLRHHPILFSDPVYYHRIVHNEISDCATGILIRTLTPTVIQDNRITDGGIGIGFFLGSNTEAHRVRRNRIENVDVGIIVRDQAVVEIKDNRIVVHEESSILEGLEKTVGILLLSDRGSLVEHNIIQGAEVGVALGWKSDNSTMSGHGVVRSNVIETTSPKGIGVLAAATGFTRIEDNTLSGPADNLAGIGISVFCAFEDSVIGATDPGGLISGNLIERFQTGIRLDTIRRVPILDNKLRWVNNGVSGVVFGAAAHLENNELRLNPVPFPMAVGFAPEQGDMDFEYLHPDTPRHVLRNNDMAVDPEGLNIPPDDTTPPPLYRLAAATPEAGSMAVGELEIAHPLYVMLAWGPAAILDANEIVGLVTAALHPAATGVTEILDNYITHGVSLVLNADSLIQGNTIGLEDDGIRIGREIQPIDRGGLMIRGLPGMSNGEHRIFDNRLRGGLLELGDWIVYNAALDIRGVARLEVFDNEIGGGGMALDLDLSAWHFFSESVVENNSVIGGIRWSGGEYGAAEARIENNTLSDDATGRARLALLLEERYGGDEEVVELAAVFEPGLDVDLEGIDRLRVKDNIVPAGAKVVSAGRIDVIANRFEDGFLRVHSTHAGHRVTDNTIGQGLEVWAGWLTVPDQDAAFDAVVVADNVIGDGGMMLWIAVPGHVKVRDNTIAEGLLDFEIGAAQGGLVIENNRAESSLLKLWGFLTTDTVTVMGNDVADMWLRDLTVTRLNITGNRVRVYDGFGGGLEIDGLIAGHVRLDGNRVDGYWYDVEPARGIGIDVRGQIETRLDIIDNTIASHGLRVEFTNPVAVADSLTHIHANVVSGGIVLQSVIGARIDANEISGDLQVFGASHRPHLIDSNMIQAGGIVLNTPPVTETSMWGGFDTDGQEIIRSGDMTMVAGIAHSLALDAEGTVWAWGTNNMGQLGLGDTFNRQAPHPVPGLPEIVAIAAGGSHSLALDVDGTVWAWGDNFYGQLGDGTFFGRRLSPFAIDALSGVTAIAAGMAHSLAIDAQGTVWAWGENESGQLGDDSRTDRSVPVEVQGLPAARMIAAGTEHSLALDHDGAIWAWGDNAFGQLGDGSLQQRNLPVAIENIPDMMAFDAGGFHNLAVDGDGMVWSWGRNDYGQVGDGTFVNRNIPVMLDQMTAVRRVSASSFGHSLALDGQGQVWVWGLNEYGQLGIPGDAPQPLPMAVEGAVSGIAIAAGGFHSLILSSDTDVCPIHRIRGNTIEGGAIGIDLAAGTQVLIHDNPRIVGDDVGIRWSVSDMVPMSGAILENAHVEGAVWAVKIFERTPLSFDGSENAWVVRANELIGGVFAGTSHPVLIEHNTIRDGITGAYLAGAHAVAQFNEIRNHTGSGILTVAPALIVNNRITDNLVGVEIRAPGQEHAGNTPPGQWTRIFNNQIAANAAYGILVGDHARIEANCLDGNRIGIRVQPWLEEVENGRPRVTLRMPVLFVIENNLIRHSHEDALRLDVTPDIYHFFRNHGLVNRLVNNTIASTQSLDHAAVNIRYHTYGHGEPPLPIVMRNNVIVVLEKMTGELLAIETNSEMSPALMQSLLHAGCNLYYSRSTNAFRVVSQGEPTVYSFAEWVSVYNLDRDAIWGDPRFVDHETFQLNEDSPAIDAGCPESAPENDRLGFPRSDLPDIGSEEFRRRGDDDTPPIIVETLPARQDREDGALTMLIEKIELITNRPLDPETANHAGHYQLFRTGEDGDQLIDLLPGYQPGSTLVTLHILGGPLDGGEYRLRVEGVTDSLGRLLRGVERDVTRFTVVDSAVTVELLSEPITGAIMDDMLAQVQLTGQPRYPVYVYVSTDPGGIADPSARWLVFRPETWEQPQTLTMAAAGDAGDLPDTIYSLAFTAMQSVDRRYDAMLPIDYEIQHTNRGALWWEFVFDDRGSVSAPAIGSDGTIYVTTSGGQDHSWSSRTGNLYALSADGQLLWRYETEPGMTFVREPVVGRDGSIFLSADNRALYAFNPDGSLRWTLAGDDDGMYGNALALGRDGTLYAASDALRAFTSAGQLLWEYPVVSHAVPAIGEDGTIYIVSPNGMLHAVNPDGTHQWRWEPDRISEWSEGPLAIDGDGTIYVALEFYEFASSETILFAINPDGSLKWTFNSGWYGETPVIGADGTLYMAAGSLLALDQDGNLLWTFEGEDGWRWRSIPALGADGTIYAGNDDDSLYAINADGTMLWRRPMDETDFMFWGQLTLGKEGTLYVANRAGQGALYAVRGHTPLADSPWPQYQRDPGNTGAIPWPFEDVIPVVEEVIVNEGAAQRSMLRRLDVVFNVPVDLSLGSIRLINRLSGETLDDGDYATVWNGLTRTVTITFPGLTVGSLPNGMFTLELDASGIRGIGGLKLDGNHDGEPGGKFGFDFHRLFGDTTGSGAIDNLDILRFRGAIGAEASDPEYDEIFDPDGEGSIGAAGYNQLIAGLAAESGPVTMCMISINDGDPQRSGVVSLSIAFDADVSAFISSASLRLDAGGAPVDPANILVEWNPHALTARMTFPGFPGGSLPDGRYTLTVDADDFDDGVGAGLDASGDGEPGGILVFEFHRLFGDSTGTGYVDNLDVLRFRRTMNRVAGDPDFDARFDVDGGGAVGDMARSAMLEALDAPARPVAGSSGDDASSESVMAARTSSAQRTPSLSDSGEPSSVAVKAEAHEPAGSTGIGSGVPRWPSMWRMPLAASRHAILDSTEGSGWHDLRPWRHRFSFLTGHDESQLQEDAGYDGFSI